MSGVSGFSFPSVRDSTSTQLPTRAGGFHPLAVGTMPEPFLRGFQGPQVLGSWLFQRSPGNSWHLSPACLMFQSFDHSHLVRLLSALLCKREVDGGVRAESLSWSISPVCPGPCKSLRVMVRRQSNPYLPFLFRSLACKFPTGMPIYSSHTLCIMGLVLSSVL